MHYAASLGISVGTAFAGMVMEYKRNAAGENEVEQRPAFDPGRSCVELGVVWRLLRN